LEAYVHASFTLVGSRWRAGQRSRPTAATRAVRLSCGNGSEPWRSEVRRWSRWSVWAGFRIVLVCFGTCGEG